MRTWDTLRGEWASEPLRDPRPDSPPEISSDTVLPWRLSVGITFLASENEIENGGQDFEDELHDALLDLIEKHIARHSGEVKSRFSCEIEGD